VGVLIALFRDGHHRKHPLFVAYIAYELVQFPLAFYLISAKSVSAEAYLSWSTFILAGSVLLRFGVIYELFRDLAKTYKSLARFSRLAFRSLLAIFLLIAVGLVAFSWPGNLHQMTLFKTFVLDRAVNLLQLGLLLGLFGIAKFFGLSWRKHVFGITLGFAVYLSVQLMAAAIQAEWGYYKVFDYITMATFHASVLVWLLYVLLPESQTALTSVPDAADVAAWNREVERLLHSK